MSFDHQVKERVKSDTTKKRLTIGKTFSFIEINLMKFFSPIIVFNGKRNYLQYNLETRLF
jgi:hypothetical protein